MSYSNPKVRYGVLLKQDRRFGTWRRRMVVVDAAQQAVILSHITLRTGALEKPHKIPFSQISHVCVRQDDPFVFEIELQVYAFDQATSAAAGIRVVLLKALSTNDARDWVDALNRMVPRMKARRETASLSLLIKPPKPPKPAHLRPGAVGGSMDTSPLSHGGNHGGQGSIHRNFLNHSPLAMPSNESNAPLQRSSFIPNGRDSASASHQTRMNHARANVGGTATQHGHVPWTGSNSISSKDSEQGGEGKAGGSRVIVKPSTEQRRVPPPPPPPLPASRPPINIQRMASNAACQAQSLPVVPPRPKSLATVPPPVPSRPAASLVPRLQPSYGGVKSA
jgi:hypothetical protein